MGRRSALLSWRLVLCLVCVTRLVDASQAAVRPPVQIEGLAGKYAMAAYTSALTKGEKNLSKVESDLRYFHDILKSDSPDASKLRSFLTNPTVSSQTRTTTVR